jgi:glutaminyl-peptide cyclotransferase
VPCCPVQRTLRPRALSPPSCTPGTTLELIFFDGEEAFKEWTATDSIYGSRHLAEKWASERVGERTRLEAIELFVLLDLLGAKGPTIWSSFKQTFKWHSMLVSAEQRLARLGLLQERDGAIFIPEQPPHPPQIEDDHIPFLRRGVPVVHAIALPFPKTWHTPDDNEANLHMPTIENLGRILRVFVCEYLGLSPN